MKCIKSTNKAGVIDRVDDDKAETLVKTGKWRYVPKWEWKQQRARQEAA